MIEIKELHKSFGAHQVLNNINVSFEKGRICGVVGENGSGKTTLFRCIAGLEKFDGSITSGFEKLKDHLGLLFTESFFFDKLTGKEYIQLMCMARKVETGNIAVRNIFDLPLDKYASTYSTGMKKKLALTGMLLQNNDCFILDEPFNGVDIQSNIIITDIILHLKKLGKTVIISSHIFSTLADVCDEIHHLKEGSFIRKVLKSEFSVLEEEMKKLTVGNKIQQLGLL